MSLERENRELKKMLAESLLKNRVLQAVCEKGLFPENSPALLALGEAFKRAVQSRRDERRTLECEGSFRP